MELKDLRIVIIKRSYKYVAQCLEYDISAQGDTIPAVIRAWNAVFTSQVALDMSQGRLPLADIPQAPGEYEEIFNTSKTRLERYEVPTSASGRKRAVVAIAG